MQHEIEPISATSPVPLELTAEWLVELGLIESLQCIIRALHASWVVDSDAFLDLVKDLGIYGLARVRVGQTMT